MIGEDGRNKGFLERLINSLTELIRRIFRRHNNAAGEIPKSDPDAMRRVEHQYLMCVKYPQISGKDPEDVRKAVDFLLTPDPPRPERKAAETGLEPYWKLRRQIENEEKKMFDMCHRMKRAKRKKIRNRYKTRFRKHGRKVISMYKRLEQMEKEAYRNGRVIERPYFVGRGCI